MRWLPIIQHAFLIDVIALCKLRSSAIKETLQIWQLI